MGFDFDKTADEAAKSVQDTQPQGDSGGGQGQGGTSNLDDLENLDDSESQAAPTLKGKAKSRGTIEDVRSWAKEGVVKVLIDVLVTESDAEDMVGTEHTIWCCVKGPAKDVTRGKQDLAKVCRSAGKPLYNNSVKRCGNDEPLSALVGEEIGFSLVAGRQGGIFCNP